VPEVASGIHRIEFPFADRIACCYVLVGDRAAMVIDTGVDATPRTHIAPALEQIGVALEDVRYVLATHADLDHHGGHGSMRELVPEAIFLCHEADRAMVEDPERLYTDRYDGFREPHGIVEPEATRQWCLAEGRGTPIDVSLAGGERVHLGADRTLNIVHAPGHSRGHIAVLDARTGAAIVADAVLGDGLPGLDGTNVAPPTYRFVDSYLSTIGLLEQLRPTLLLTGHYPVLDASAAADLMALSRTYADRMERAIRQVLAAAPDGLTTAEVIAAVAPQAGPWSADASAGLVFPVAGHLERLAAYGAVDLDRDSGAARWRIDSQ
jgi:glyoxylase-like metal-dependent hydrolase (beta-lactamase superfamily II)